MPPFPQPAPLSLSAIASVAGSESKRKAPADDSIESVETTEQNNSSSKRTKTSTTTPSAAEPAVSTLLPSAQAASAFIPFLSPEDLLPPKLPTREEMEEVLLGLKKRALLEEYFGDSSEIPAAAKASESR